MPKERCIYLDEYKMSWHGRKRLKQRTCITKGKSLYRACSLGTGYISLRNGHFYYTFNDSHRDLIAVFLPTGILKTILDKDDKRVHKRVSKQLLRFGPLQSKQIIDMFASETPRTKNNFNR